MDDLVTRGEFDLLKQIVSENQRRIETIDGQGTKGVAVVQAQLLDLTKDVTRLEVEVNKRFDAHDLVHKQESKDRISGRRWIIGMGIAGMSSLAAILAVVLQILVHTH